MGPEAQGYQPSDDEIEESRKASDKELIEGGAKIKEGKLQITDEQYEHLHKEMEVELAADPEAKGSVVDYIKSHIEADLSFQPQIKREVAKVLDALLKLSKGGDKDFILQPVILLHQLENDPRIKELTGRGFVFLHESKKAAMNFPQLNDEQRKEVEEYIQGMIEKEVSQTLEQYMTEQLGLKAEQNWNPDTQSSDEGKSLMVAFAAMNAGNLEDFTLNVPRGQEKGSDEVESIVSAYYRDQGYEVKSDFGVLIAEKGDQRLFINISNWGEKIMVSVINM